MLKIALYRVFLITVVALAVASLFVKNLWSMVSKPLEETRKIRQTKNPKQLPLPAPLQVLEQYKQWHSVEALERDPNNDKRKFAIGVYSCPLRAGNRLHHYMNDFLWAILTNRTLLWQYQNEKKCRRQVETCGKQYCDQVLKRASWVPSYAEWSSKLTLEKPQTIPPEATLASVRPELLRKYPQFGLRGDELRGVDVEDKYPFQVARFQGVEHGTPEMQEKTVQELLLHTDRGRRTASKLFQLGVNFMYGMLYRHSFELRKRFRPPYQAKSSSVFSLAIHSRHNLDNMDGCDIQPDIDCLEELLSEKSPGQKAWATIMSDRSCTIDKVREWLEKRNVTVEIANHTMGESSRSEHGPFAGVGYFQDMELASKVRDAFVVSTWPDKKWLRSSSELPLELMEYGRRMEVFNAGHDPVRVKALKICKIEPNLLK